MVAPSETIPAEKANLGPFSMIIAGRLLFLIVLCAASGLAGEFV